MQFDLLISNLTSPTLLFFLLGVIASLVKSDLEIPPSTSKFISLYLLFSIGFKGGQELSHSVMSMEIALTLLLAVALAVVVPIYTFFLLKRKFSIENAGAVAAAYGSVSAVTFVTAIAFLDNMGIAYGGHMVAAMALMEAPAIVVGVMLMRRFSKDIDSSHSVGGLLRESLTNGSVLMILGSLLIGLVADTKQAEGIKPFTTDIFKGFLVIFLLEMGMIAARRFQSFWSNGVYAAVFALVFPPLNGLLAIAVTYNMAMAPGNRLLFTVLASSASYIAVPAAMRQIAPKADPGLYIPMALAITFPLNITLGLPIYWSLVSA